MEVAKDSCQPHTRERVATGLFCSIRPLWWHPGISGNHQGNCIFVAPRRGICLPRFRTEKGRNAMLHTETVERTTLGLLKNLLAEPRIASFCLAGGTALSLYLGHRWSVDLDLFSPAPFDVVELKEF